MRYRYRGTNTIVESSFALDSAIFTPLVEQTEEAGVKEDKQEVQPEKKTQPKRTTSRRKRG